VKPFVPCLVLLTACEGLLDPFFVPEDGFGEQAQPAAPDYGELTSWASLPDMPDPADLAAEGETNEQSVAIADVFFVPPTTFVSTDFWNQSLDDADTNRATDAVSSANMASAFNGVGRVFSPRYRQATLGVYLTTRVSEADMALELAYEDVLRAFDTYLENWNDGRPIVIAGHSQGAAHAYRLLAERFARPSALRRQLVAAYLVGASIPVSAAEITLDGIPPCTRPRQNTCFVSWNTLAEEATRTWVSSARVWRPSDAVPSMGPLVCTNPVSWRDDTDGDAAHHRGAVRITESLVPRPHALSARCDGSTLRIALDDPHLETWAIAGDYHPADIPLFYLDVRENLADRLAAF
jgi:pimeloyl-ACP methyl ester carboxylesterase